MVCIENAYNFTSDTAKVLDRTEWALLSIALVVSLASLLIEARLKEKEIHLGEREKD